jgi:ketosteroid isomerase-like protein
MADTSRADRFAQALQQMEQSGDPSDLLAQFSDGAELKRPELEHSQGPTKDADAFWAAYRDQFSEISTEFSHVAESGDVAVLEWHSTATLAAGRSIEYAGVSLLTFGDDDKVSRFSTYYDTAAFLTPAS